MTFHYIKCRAALKNGIIKRVRKLQIHLYTVKSFNLMNSLIFWVTRNAKALKGPILAGEGNRRPRDYVPVPQNPPHCAHPHALIGVRAHNGEFVCILST